MDCAELETLLADYIDGVLPAGTRAAVDQHIGNCAGCSEFLRDAMEGATLLSRMPEVEPPQELVTRIAFHSPVGRARDPQERPNFLSRLTTRWLQPFLQPKFAMGMAMTILSFAMLERCTGVRVERIQAADLSPTHIWEGVEDKAIRTKDRAIKYYENIRLVYEVETRLRQLEQERDAADEERTNRRGPSAPSRPESGVSKASGGLAAPQKGGSTK